MDCSITDPKDMGLAAGSASSHRVEISGWDDKGYYFIEKAMRDRNETDGKTIVMRSAIRQNSVLFMRLGRPLGGGTGLPVPCRAVKVTGNYRGPRLTVKLEQLHPRMAFRETADSLLRSDAKVA